MLTQIAMREMTIPEIRETFEGYMDLLECVEIDEWTVREFIDSVPHDCGTISIPEILIWIVNSRRE